MPRSARIDLEGILQHVMIRGIEKRDIFLDDRDRANFVERFSNLLRETNTDCLAWSLLSNHAHMLLRPRNGNLSGLMRRLLTGYAVVFNLRHDRSGHLFQNRYRSIVCEEESYLLELVRYIHLNPLRAGLVNSLQDLDVWKWSGHAVIMGHADLCGQARDDVLQLFHDNQQKAVATYHDFVAGGIPLGQRDDLVGGGLKRHLASSGCADIGPYDERILGSGEFVEEVLGETASQTVAASPPALDEVIDGVAAVFDVDAVALRGRSKDKHVSTARAAICYIATRIFGYHGVDLTNSLDISQSGVVLAARRGEALFDQMPALTELVVQLRDATISPAYVPPLSAPGRVTQYIKNVPFQVAPRDGVTVGTGSVIQDPSPSPEE